MEFRIALNSIEDAVKLVNKLELYGCTADALIGDRVIDARSLMGIIEFGLGREIAIRIYPEINEELHAELYEMLTA